MSSNAFRNSRPRKNHPKPPLLGSLSFSFHEITLPALTAWVMHGDAGLPWLPFWASRAPYAAAEQRLRDIFQVTTPSDLVDWFYLKQLHQTLGNALHVIFSSTLREELEMALPSVERTAYIRGQGCQYRLEALFHDRLSLQWVPSAAPHSIVANPSFETLWRLFKQTGRKGGIANQMSYFSLTNQAVFVDVARLLIEPHPSHTEALAPLVDGFGCYSSSLHSLVVTSAVHYSAHESASSLTSSWQESLILTIDTARRHLIADPTAPTVLRLLNTLR